jgi:hypothetical protein
MLPAVAAARRHVGIDENTFRTHTFHGFPRQFFVWSALDEIDKACFFLMRLDDFLGEGESEGAPRGRPDSFERTPEALVLEEEHLRARRLCELLVQIVLFARKDESQLYEHFLLLEELVRLAAYNVELEEFHAMPSAWIRADLERLALGTTYGEAFGAPSETIHYQAAGGRRPPSSVRELIGEGTRLCIASFCVTRRIHELLGKPPIVQLEQIHRVVVGNREASRHIEDLNTRSAVAVGDFVLARGYLAVDDATLRKTAIAAWERGLRDEVHFGMTQRSARRST